MAKKKIARQGMSVTIKELRDLADELASAHAKLLENLGLQITSSEINNQKHIINIINKTPKCSDTWEIEK